MTISKNELASVLYDQLIDKGFNQKLVEFIVAQSAHETNNFSSRVLKQANNLFGMKYAGQELAESKYKDFAKYENIEDSIDDYVRYYVRHQYFGTYPSIASFVKALKDERYFEADVDEYIKGVTFFHNLYFGE